jgi:hypothetical protein
MSKLHRLRQIVLDSAHIEADQLFTRVTKGKVAGHANADPERSTLRYEAEVEIIIIDFSQELHPVTRALADWLRKFEDAAIDALEFELDLIDHAHLDVRFTLPFTEVVQFDGLEFAACDKELDDVDAVLLAHSPDTLTP